VERRSAPTIFLKWIVLVTLIGQIGAVAKYSNVGPQAVTATYETETFSVCLIYTAFSSLILCLFIIYLLVKHTHLHILTSKVETQVNIKMSTTISTTLTGTTTSTASSPSTTSTGIHSCPQTTWEIPTTDAACAIHPSSLHNATDVLSQCCGVASVISYDDGCASYCLAQGQNVSVLETCLQSNGGDPFCNSGLNATATAAVSSSTASKTGGSTTGTGTATGTSASSTKSGAAVKTTKVSTGGVGVIALLFCSALFGALA
jgi:hypothetical protein